MSGKAKAAQLLWSCKGDTTWHRMLWGCIVRPWVKFVGLLLIAVVVVIVIAPEIDLPLTVTRCSYTGYTLALVAFAAVIHARIILLAHRFITLSVRVVLPAHGDSSGSLIDLNCTRLC
jgi:hypothetical protein